MLQCALTRTFLQLKAGQLYRTKFKSLLIFYKYLKKQRWCPTLMLFSHGEFNMINYTANDHKKMFSNKYLVCKNKHVNRNV